MRSAVAGADERGAADEMSLRRMAGPTPSCEPEALRPEKELLAAWLLLLLDDGESHGYELRRRLRDCRLDIDSGNLYRWLRRLERDGSVQSCWIESEGGPQRRSYRLTGKGRSTLGEIAGLITRMRDNHDAFLRAYDPVHGHG